MNFDNWGDSPLYSGGVPAITAPVVNAPKPGAFSKGGNAWKIMGLIGDAMQVGAGGHASYMPAMLDLQQKVDEERKTQAHLAAQAQAIDALPIAPEQKAAMKAGVLKYSDVKAPNNDTVNDYQFLTDKLGADAGTQYLRGKADPIVNIPLPNGEVYMGPRSGIPGVGGGVPAQPQAQAQPFDAGAVMQSAFQSKRIMPDQNQAILQHLGPNGSAGYKDWLKRSGIRVVVRTGTDANGRKVAQYEDGSVDYAD